MPPPQIVTCVPTSTTRPVGIWKKSVAFDAVLESQMNSLSCQRGMPDCAAGRSTRRERKKEVAMMSKETQDVANEIDKLADEVFPYCWKYLRK